MFGIAFRSGLAAGLAAFLAFAYIGKPLPRGKIVWTSFLAYAISNNVGLASLGKTCALGLILDAIISIFLLPFERPDAISSTFRRTRTIAASSAQGISIGPESRER